jgi:hypothetical protein
MLLRNCERHTRVYIDGTWRLWLKVSNNSQIDVENRLENDDQMTLGGDWISLLPVGSEIVVTPENFWLDGAWRK